MRSDLVEWRSLAAKLVPTRNLINSFVHIWNNTLTKLHLALNVKLWSKLIDRHLSYSTTVYGSTNYKSTSLAERRSLF